MTAPKQERLASLRQIAAELIWWQPPEVSLSQPVRFLAQVMALGTWQEVRTIQEAYGKDALREILNEAPPGVFDRRSWSYWHAVFGLSEPPMPQRSFR
ncbi:MAG: hypothetical protein HZA91_03835 [Verrucomicrobia bacterium]|nr:hypothetical protein [Verrucomicrobiota bacterium]